MNSNYIILFEDNTALPCIAEDTREGEDFGKDVIGNLSSVLGFTDLESIDQPYNREKVVAINSQFILSPEQNIKQPVSVNNYVKAFVIRNKINFKVKNSLIIYTDAIDLLIKDSRSLVAIGKEENIHLLKNKLSTHPRFEDIDFFNAAKEQKVYKYEKQLMNKKKIFRKKRLLCIDFGISKDLLDLAVKFFDIIVVDHHTSANTVALFKPDVIMMSDGPGNIDFLTNQMKENILKIIALNIKIISFGISSYILAKIHGAKIATEEKSITYTDYKIFDCITNRAVSAVKSSNYSIVEFNDDLFKVVAKFPENYYLNKIAGFKIGNKILCFCTTVIAADSTSDYFFEQFLK